MLNYTILKEFKLFYIDSKKVREILSQQKRQGMIPAIKISILAGVIGLEPRHIGNFKAFLGLCPDNDFEEVGSQF